MTDLNLLNRPALRAPLLLKRRGIGVPVLLFLLLCTVPAFSQISNQKFHFSCPGGVTITYDLVACGGNATDVTLWYSADMSSWAKAITVSGDVGTVPAGNNKTILWDNATDKVKNGNFYFKITSDPISVAVFKSVSPVPATQYVDVLVKVDASGNGTTAITGLTKTMRFLTYNLGANPALSPKEQMAYSPLGIYDPAVYGGFYQWGRKDSRHTFRCDPTPNATSDPKFTKALIPTASLPGSDDGKFVWGQTSPDPITLNQYNWASPHVNNSDLWGNGGGLLTQSTTAYTATQNTQNPCPSGYRVPTEHEWALLGWEGGSSTSDDYDYDCFSGLGSVIFTTAKSDLVWVKVMNGVPSLSFSAAGVCGYALYRLSDWNAAIGVGGYFQGLLQTTSNFAVMFPGKKLYDAGAPTPLLFLPAAGYRGYLDGLVYDVGKSGFYWSSTVNGNNSYYLQFYETFVNANRYYYRVNGFPVRCIAE